MRQGEDESRLKWAQGVRMPTLGVRSASLGELFVPTHQSSHLALQLGSVCRESVAGNGGKIVSGGRYLHYSSQGLRRVG